MNVLLTFTGFQDPYSLGLVGQEEQPGPILSLIASRSFERVVLFSTPNTQKNTSATKEILQETHPRIEVEVRELVLDDPTDYFSILKGLRAHLQSICANPTGTTFYVAVASGTPQMHACWVLLTASGELPANLLYIRPPRFVSKDHPLISEVNPSSSGFSWVQTGFVVSPIPLPDPETIAQQIGIVGDHPSILKNYSLRAVYHFVLK